MKHIEDKFRKSITKETLRAKVRLANRLIIALHSPSDTPTYRLTKQQYVHHNKQCATFDKAIDQLVITHSIWLPG